MRSTVALLLLLMTPAAALADAYGEALMTARQQAASGRFKEAAQSLEGPAASWPQDVPLQLALAFYLLRAGDYGAAEDQYGVVLALEPASEEARQGLAAAQLDRGAPSQAWVGLYGTATTYTGQTSASPLLTAVLTLDAQLADRWVVGALYRVLGSTSGITGGGGGQGGGDTVPIQQEGHLSFGLASPDWQLVLHGAAISRVAVTKAGVEQVYGYGGVAAGLSAMARYGLEWRGSAVASWYEDLTVYQVEGTAALPLGDHLALRAGARTQLSAGAAHVAALAGVEWRGPFNLSLSGEFGPQLRPADLVVRVLYDVSAELLWAARLQAGFPLGHHVRGWLGADLEGWRTQATSGLPADSTGARLSAGLSFSF